MAHLVAATTSAAVAAASTAVAAAASAAASAATTVASDIVARLAPPASATPAPAASPVAAAVAPSRWPNGVHGTFREAHGFEARAAEARRVRAANTKCVPVIVERAARTRDLPCLDKAKYLVPRDVTVSQFVYVLRKHMGALTPDKALFVYTDGGIMPTSGARVGDVHAMYRDADGFLYMQYAGESTFGGGWHFKF